MDFSVRVGYPENGEYSWKEALQQYADVGRVEAAFYSTELFLRNVKLEDVVGPFKKIPELEVSSVHMAHVRITDFPLFELVLKKTAEIAKALGCENIVVHPSKGKLEDVVVFIEEKIDPILRREKIYLCWETFTSKKRFLSGIGGIAEFCRDKQWHRVCYDFSHIHDEQEIVIKQIEKYFEFIKIFHVSNRISEKKLQHLPVFHKGAGRLDLNFVPVIRFLKEKDFGGSVVLEYLPEFHKELKKDALFLINKYG